VRPLLFAAGFAAGAVLVAATPLPFLVALLTALLVVGLPLASRLPGDVEAQVLAAPRSALYASTALGLWALAALVLAGALLSGWGTAALGLTWPGTASFAAWTAAASLAGAALLALAPALGLPESPLLHHLLPRTAGERAAFAGVSVTAGVTEELVFRGFLVTALIVIVGSPLAAALIAAAAFGLSHAYQGRVGALRAAVLGLLLTVPFLATGSILAPMAAHVLLDLFGGLWLGPRLRARAADGDHGGDDA
jgi:uncharacterized protein